MAAAMIPVLSPATLQDYIDFGLLGFALSRFSGCWVGFKAVGQTVETSGTVEIGPDRPRIVIPNDFEMPPGGLSIRDPAFARIFPTTALMAHVLGDNRLHAISASRCY